MFRSERACPPGRESGLLKGTKCEGRTDSLQYSSLPTLFRSVGKAGKVCLELIHLVFASAELKE